MIGKPIKKLLLIAILLIACVSLYAQTRLFWEDPARFTAGEGNFPVSSSNEHLSILVWQEPSRRPAAGVSSEGIIHLALAVKMPGQPWEQRGTIGGPYGYSGSEPSIVTAIVDDTNRIFIAVAASPLETELLISEDYGLTFERFRLESGAETSLAPRIAVAANGEYLLFITRGREESLSIFYSRSVDGRTWDDFRQFETDPRLRLTFLPSHTSLNGRDYVAFQSLTLNEGIPTAQLYVKVSNDGGRSWSASRLFTNFQDRFINAAAAASSFDNQRAHLSVQGNDPFIVWERRYRNGLSQIYAARMQADGSISGEPERVSSISAFGQNPIAFSFDDTPMVVWFEQRIFFARRLGSTWEERVLSVAPAESSDAFGRPVTDSVDGFFIFWQNTSQQGATHIHYLAPDTSVSTVQIEGRNFTSGQKVRSDRAEVTLHPPYDSSGIQGFAWTWSQDETLEPERSIQTYNTGAPPELEHHAEEDGSWFFTVIAQDFAGNWSRPSRVEFIRDTTPPPAASIIQPELDRDGYLLSNTFALHWNAPPASDIAGYTWDLQYLGASSGFQGMDNEQFSAAAEERFQGTSLSLPQIQGRDTVASFENQENGVWRFSVRAVDDVGNVGPESAIFFRTNKYIARTYITLVDTIEDEAGFLNISIIGRGFSRGGNVRRIVLSRDGALPFEREFLLSRGEFRVESDSEIRALIVDGLPEGRYRVGVEHPVRGMHLTDPVLEIREGRTVKPGDYTNAWKPLWLITPERRFTLNTVNLIFIAMLALALVGLIASARGIQSTLAENSALRLDAAAIISGDLMPSEKKIRIRRIKRRGIGLRIKLASFTITLIFAVISMIALPLYRTMERVQQQTLIQGLWDRSLVLVEGIASSARTHIPLQSILELGLLPGQMTSIPEAQYITITGYNPETTIFADQVWATNDPNILDKIDTANFQPGISRITDVLSPHLEDFSQALNEEARRAVSGLSESIAVLTQEGLSLAPRTDAQSIQRLNDIQIQTRTLQTRVGEQLAEISRVNIGSEPYFDRENFVIPPDNTYIFFKPVMFRQGTEDVYFRGLVRLEVSITSILQEIEAAKAAIIRVILMVALLAQAAGIFGAFVLASLIIRPIQQLVGHIEVIRDTEDKAKLSGIDISIKSHDELAILGDTINEMTHGLVKAAQAATDLSVGKEIQKKFIPLELDSEGNKLSYGFKETPFLTFFGYYEGAKGVSGDYFDYQDLDGRYYAIIKCDVAGKGIPAALIMIQVATMFLNYFKHWKPNRKGMQIEDVVYQINDFIETLAFKGRFAAFTLCLYDSETGIVRFCNAGDNLVHIVDAAEKRLKTITLPPTPATGVLPNFLVESKGGYKVQTVTLNPGDILLLYTDGIEEAKRKFRNAAFREITCETGAQDSPHENHTSGQSNEELGADRVEAIINAVMNKEVYTLHKWHNGEGEGKDLTFDFTSCEGSVEDVIKALISVEKMFRCYKSPKASEEARVFIDKTVDAFLKQHFRQYRNYCAFTREPSGNSSYVCYTHINEDEQYDDLTILGIKRK